MRRQSIPALAVVGTFLVCAGAARAGIIVDADFFSDMLRTLVTFELDGSGEPVTLGSGNFTFFENDEYADLGFTFAPGVSPGVAWVGAYDDAEAVGGSPPIALAARDNVGDFFIDFWVPVRAFGFFVMRGKAVEGVLTFEVYHDGGLVGMARFEGEAIDRTSGPSDYGFLGIAVGQDIDRIHVTGGVAGLDNFTFSPVPEPCTVLLLATGGIALLLRRRSL
jgi:hypothetical protein